MNLSTEKIDIPKDCNIILGQSHFIKTVEDLYEIMVAQVPSARFGLAFCEASGPCLIRTDGNDQDLIEAAVESARRISAGHIFIIVMADIFPINILNAVKDCPEVCRIFCATANPVEVIIGETEQGRGVMGVIDGFRPKGVESDQDKKDRHVLLRKFNYKR
jgi:adenosine/AMP kinase